MKSNILIVDDSALLRRVECDIINSDNKLQATDTQYRLYKEKPSVNWAFCYVILYLLF